MCKFHIAAAVFAIGFAQIRSASGQEALRVFEQPKSSYHLAKSYAIGGMYKWGDIALDSTSKRIYVAHYNRVEVLDQDSGSRVGDVLGVPDVRAIAVAPDLHLAFTANGGENHAADDRGSITVFDTNTLESLGKAAANHPESVLFDPFTQRVFALSERTTVIDAKSREKVAEIDLEGEPAAAISDEHGTVFVNLSDKKTVAVIDATKLQVVKRLPVPHCVSPHSLAFDSREQRLFVGCDDGYLIVMNSTSGKAINRVQMCSGVGGSAYDQDNRLVFESCDEGVISVIHENATNAYDLIDTVKTQLWAASMVLDPKSKAIYLPTADFKPIPTKDDPTKSFLMPGTLRVLVVAPDAGQESLGK